jgi:hypothetical protein
MSLKLLKEMGLSDEKIKNNKDKIREFLGFPTGLTSQEQDKLRAEIKGKSIDKEGNPPIEEEEYKIEKYDYALSSEKVMAAELTQA